MNKEQVFEVIKKSIVTIRPDIEPGLIVLETSLRDLGADSVDRADILILILETLKLKFPLHEMGAARNLKELVDFFHGKMHSGNT